jgi:hypothetical protein
MSTGNIRLYEQRGSIRAVEQRRFVEDPPVHADWATYGPTRRVRSLAVDPGTGGVVVGTRAGVLVWDRRTAVVKRYGSEHGLAGNDVSCVAVDRRGRLWAGHAEGGLSVFDGGWRPAGDPNAPVVTLAPFGDGVAAVTADSVRFAPESRAAVSLREVGPVAAVLEVDRDLIVCGERGLFNLSASRHSFKGRWCVGLVSGEKGEAWLATHQTLYRWNGDPKADLEPVHTPEGAPITALAFADGLPWVLRGGRLFACAERGWLDAGLSGLRALAALPRDGHVWAGGDGGLWMAWLDGVVCVSDQLLPVVPNDDAYPARCVALTGGRTYLGTQAGLVRDGQLLPAGDVRQLCVCAGDLYLLAWPEGVARVGEDLSWLEPLPEGVLLGLGAGRNGGLHLLTTRGFYARHDGWQLVGDGGDEEAGGLVQTEDGTWWLGHSQGVLRLREGHWDLAGEQAGPAGAEVRGLVALGPYLMAATARGLWQWHGGRWVQHLSEPFRAVGSDRGRGLWLAGEEGLVRFDADPGTAPLRLTPRDGVPGRRVVALACREDLWVVTDEGVGHLRGVGR